MTPAEYDLAAAVLAGVDEAVAAAERHWGVGRLRLLVDDGLRARWDRQWREWSRACAAYDVPAIGAQGAAVRRGLSALAAAATAAGHGPLDVEAWETRLPDGRVLAIVRTRAEAWEAQRAGRAAEVWTLEEVARVLGGLPIVGAVKQAFPGSTVTAARQRVDLSGEAGLLDDDLPPDWYGAG